MAQIEVKFKIGDMCVTFNAHKLAMVKIVGIGINKFGVVYEVLFNGNDIAQASKIKEEYLFHDVAELVDTINRKKQYLGYGRQVSIDTKYDE